MKQYHIVWKGIQPLIMHSCCTVNPLHPITREIKAITSKPAKSKTEEDYARISDLELEGSIYWDDAVGLYIPAENIEATIRDAAKNQRKGKDIARFLNVVDLMNPLDVGEEITKEKILSDYRFRDVRQMKVMRARVTRTRGRFDHWKVGFDVLIDEANLDPSFLEDIMNYAGQYVGLCDSRPKYGKFTVLSIKEVPMSIPA